MSGILRNKNKRIITLILTLLMAFGTAVPALSPATLAADDTVTLSFTHTVNLQTAYFNALFVNGSFFEYLVNGGKTSQSIDIPKNLLHQGENTISFICGNNTTQTYYNINQAPTTRNHNDPPISNLRLDADGTVSSPTRLIKHFPTDKSIPVAQSERTENADYSDDVTYVFGDGTGGVNADINVPYMIDFVFDLDLDEPGGGHADGDGRAYLDFGSTGIQVTDSNHFKDGTYLNGEFYQYLTSDNTQQKLTLDPLRMLPGQVNVFSFVIGNGSGIYDPTVNPGAVNHDDFGVGSLTMTLPNGEIAAPGQVVLYTAVGATTPAAIEHNEITETYSSVKNYAMGDGFPAGANLSLAYRIDFLFDLTGTEWDGSYTPDVPVITLKNVSLQIGADPTRRNLVWYSNSSLAGTVQLALKSAMTGDEFPAVNAEFSAEKEASNLTGFSVNKATITGLAANTEYVYRVGNSEGRSDIYSFKTQSFDGAFSFLAAGDPQIGVRAVATDVAGWTDTLNKSFNAFPDASFLVTLGDQVQNAGSEEQYDGLFGPNVLKSIPLATVVGNHDTNPIYSQHFYMPNASATYGLSRSQDNLGDAGPYAGDYWYTYGNTLFMSLNITNLSVAEHRAFMEATIAANPDVKWKVVTEHFSLFHITNSGYWTITDPLRNELAPVFSELGIDVVLNGHDHSYQRTYLINGLTPDASTGGAEVTNPAAGGVLYINTNSASGSLYCSINNTASPAIAVRNQESRPNISKIDVTDDSFTITTYRTNDMSVVDAFTINKTEVPMSLTATAGEGKVTLRVPAAPEGATAAELQISSGGDVWQTLSTAPLADGGARGAYLSGALGEGSVAVDVLGLTAGKQYLFKLIVTGGEDAGEYAADAAPAAPELYLSTLIEGNATWKYNDTNADQGTAWRAESFDDNAWKSGAGPLGYPASDSNGTFGPISSGTLVANSSNPNAYITYYFRKAFDLAAEDLARITRLDLTVGIDDGYVMYINGTEVRRLYMPAGEIGWQTHANYVNEPSSAQGTDTADITAAALPLLKSGANTVAVEVHNRDNTSSDIYFDMSLVASSNLAEPEPTTAIKNIALTIGADETRRNITWYSDSAADDGKAQLALKSAMTGDAFPAVYTEFAAARAASSVAGFSTFKAAITDLAANTEYVYRVGNDGDWSEVCTFKTSPAGDFSFLAAGDPQIGSSGNAGNDTAGWTTTLNKAQSLFPDVSLLISLGDQVETSSKENEYDGFLAPNYLRSLTLAPNIGNHDTGSGGGIFKEHFTVPNSSNTYGVTASGGDYWYTYNGVLFLSINSNDMSTAEHRAFLEDAIATYKAQNGGADPLWKIVTFHHSIYSSASHTTDTDIRARRNELSPVFAELDIDAVLAGHDHVYTRSYVMGGANGMQPITEGYDGDDLAAYTKTAPGETVYITANSASGSKFYALKTTDFAFAAKENQENTPNITKADVTADTLTFTTYRTGASNTASDTVDVFTLRKAPAAPDDDVAKADIRGDASAVKGSPVSYTVSLRNLKDAGVVTLTLTANGTHLDLKDVTALNGFSALNGIVWEDLGNNIWKGTVKLAYTGDGFLTAAGPLDILTVGGVTRDLVAETTVTLTDIRIAGNVNGSSGTLPSEIETAEATTSVTEEQAVYSPYDLNRDGDIDDLDLNIAVYYYLAKSEDADWTSVRFDTASAEDADVTGDGLVSLADLIEILANYQTSYSL